MEEHHIRIENARLKEELARVNTLSSKFLGRPISALSAMSMKNPNLGLEFNMRRNKVAGPSNSNMSLPMGFDMRNGVMGAPPPNFAMQTPMGMIENDAQQERFMLIDLALAAMNELIKMYEPDSQLWTKSPDSGKYMLNHDKYARIGSSFNSLKPNGFVTETTRETGLLYTNSATLVEIFLNAHAEGVWIVADVSIDFGRNSPNGNPYKSSKKLPSGCISQDMPNGLCKVNVFI
ncbi:hypothetical protein TSUD_404640 [Trifolium subterraneum]|uniref:START domain-containing protein n=1 Tax=Trifolium subterraneum TaxID=3900 RepID=A0A2Z6NUN8_TRISU|nr:hypothetical protein TSUD_404640 [Trifolium subterraneum]